MSHAVRNCPPNGGSVHLITITNVQNSAVLRKFQKNTSGGGSERIFSSLVKWGLWGHITLSSGVKFIKPGPSDRRTDLPVASDVTLLSDARNGGRVGTKNLRDPPINQET